ncbi:MAG: hypothetical protein AAF202_00965 [Pseudomonadota bacterium]
MSDLKQSLKLILAGAFLGVCISAGLAYATGQIPELTGPPEKSEDVVGDPSDQKIACGDIVDSLRDYNELHFENGEAIAGYIQAVGTHMYEWNEVFTQLEDKTVTFRRAYFEPILRTAETNDEISEMIFENTDQLAQRIEKVIESLEACL